MERALVVEPTEMVGFGIATQMPCLKLNGHSINPDNDVAMRLVGSDMSRAISDLSVARARKPWAQ